MLRPNNNIDNMYIQFMLASNLGAHFCAVGWLKYYQKIVNKTGE